VSAHLRVEHLSKSFGAGVPALNDVSFEVARGEFIGVIGLSGSGKSTLLRCLNHLLIPDSGAVLLDGDRLDPRDARALRARRRRVAMIFQAYNLVPRTTALSNVLMGRLAERGWWRTLFKMHPMEACRDARAALAEVGLAAQADRRTERLSGGQRQRVAIARAIHQGAELVLADEPVASLDPATSRGVMELLRRANRERKVTVLCNLHDLNLVREFADRVLALRAGELVFSGPAADIDDAWFKKIYGGGGD
jgi:phosphonate transport system ATP-binding protein